MLKDLFLTEIQLKAEVDSLEKHYQERVELLPFKTKDGLTVYAYRQKAKNPKGELVIIPGRGEIGHKYYEFLDILYKLELNVYIFFARGQDRSSKLLLDKNKYYIDSFEHYAEDIEFMIQELKLDKFKLLAFSLGGLISLDLIKRGKVKIEAASLNAPFLWPYFKLNPIILTLFATIFGSLPKLKTSFTPGASAYKKVDFEQNYHSHCKLRYELYHGYYQKHPELTSGGVTYHFVKECLKKQLELFRSDFEFTIPVLCQSAGADRVVDSNMAKKFFLAHAKDEIAPKFELIENAYHDLLNETDEIRVRCLSTAIEFLYGKEI